MICVCGDSHVNLFCNKASIPPLYPNFEINNNFKMWRLGAPLAYSLFDYDTYYEGRKKLEFLLKTEVTKGDSVILSFGEIDCRKHLHFQAIKQGKNFDDGGVKELVSECVDKYVEAIKIIFKDQFYWIDKVGIWGPIASTWLDQRCSNRDRPISGTMPERNVITNWFNEYLKNKLDNMKNFTYLSIFKHLIDERFFTKEEFYRDEIHLGLKAVPLMIQELKEKGFI